MEDNDEKLIWENSNFPDRLREDEKVIIVIRESSVVLGLKILNLVLIFFGLSLIKIFLGSLNSILILDLFDLMNYSVNIYLIIYFILIFHNFYLSIEIVTTERIIDIDQTGLFKREVNELSLENIQDISYKQSSFFGTVFNFGNVIVQTSSENEAGRREDSINGFIFENVHNPPQIVDVISGLYHRKQKDDKKETASVNAEYIKKAFEK